MIRPIILVFLTILSVNGQDSKLVKDLCNTFAPISDTTDIESQLLGSFDIINKHVEKNPLTSDNPLQEVLRLQYRLARELIRSCPNYPSDRARLIPNPVIDLENKLTKQQIDLLDDLTSQLKKEKELYLYIVTIDEFYPDSTISDFSNRYRDYWAPQTLPNKGAVLIVVSVKQREVRISTGDISMIYLTDKESDEVIKTMIPEFKLDKHFDGLINGVKAIKSRL